MAKRDRSLRHHVYAVVREIQYILDYVNQDPAPTELSQATHDVVNNAYTGTVVQTVVDSLGVLDALPIKS